MHGHYIICGAGRVGRSVARELVRKPAPFVVVDTDDGQIALAVDRLLGQQERALRVGLLLQEQDDPFPTTVIETALMGVPGAEQVRSISKSGLSLVTVVFDDAATSLEAIRKALAGAGLDSARLDGLLAAATKRLRAEGIRASHLHLRHLSPFAKNVGEVLRQFRKVIVPEPSRT